MSILSSKAMLVSLSASFITGRKLDKRITEEVNTNHGASADAGRYNKAIFDPKSLAPVVSIVGAARTEHYRRTLPWLYDGTAILPVTGYMDYTNAMGEYRRAFEERAAEWLANYDSHIERARQSLNGMFNPADYPSRAKAARSFSFDVRVSPVPDANDFRVDVGTAAVEQIKADIEARANEALAMAMREVWERMSEVVSRVADSLKAYKPGGNGERTSGIFHSSMLANVQSLLDVIPSLNITNDQRINQIAERMRRELCAEDVKTLREAPMVRNSVAAAADSILADIGQFLA